MPHTLWWPRWRSPCSVTYHFTMKSIFQVQLHAISALCFTCELSNCVFLKCLFQFFWTLSLFGIKLPIYRTDIFENLRKRKRNVIFWTVETFGDVVNPGIGPKYPDELQQLYIRRQYLALRNHLGVCFISEVDVEGDPLGFWDIARVDLQIIHGSFFVIPIGRM